MSDSYYGRPVVKPHVWTPYVPVYFWIGGTAGAAAVHCAVARLNGQHGLATVQKRTALAGVALAPLLLIADLGVPKRFLNMLRVFKLTSPMSVGSWVLTAFGGVVTASTAAELLGMTRTSRALEFAAAGLGPLLTVYTAVLVADTATPAWHQAYDTLPFVFASSGVAGAGAVGSTFAPANERASAQRMMIGGALALAAAGQTMEHRLGKFLAEPYTRGTGGTLKHASATLAIAGAALGFAGRKSRALTAVAAACVAGAGILERFAVLAAGKQSACDPKYTVEPQRARIDAGTRAPA
ncbi:MAG: NrfD/PsrC family molybdoenzyme membrane anchor subunit [Candidatus Velthaea sp.]